LASWLIKTSSMFIEQILECLKEDIKGHSNYANNIRRPKDNKNFVFMYLDPETNVGHPVSETFWKQFKDTKPSF
ncbi:MAG TPA: hypothetical protein VGI43_02135, partial [Mucilaginibacter sp.]